MRGGDEAIVIYSLDVRMCPDECRVIRDTYLDLCEKYRYESELHPKKTDEITINPSRINTISFYHFGEISPHEIHSTVPATSNGVKILEGLEDMIGRFNPEKGDFSGKFERRIMLPRNS